MENLSGIWAANNSVQMISAVNTISEGWLIGFLMIVLYIAIVSRNYKDNLRLSSLAASFVVIILSLFMWILNWISLENLLIPIILFFIGLFTFLLVSD